MARYFNTTGPCNPVDHYMLPPESRLIRAQLNRYIEAKLYWVLHAPRQTGKTTFLHSWMRALNAGGQALACYVSVERCQQFPDAVEAVPAICTAIREYATAFLPPFLVPSVPTVEPASSLSAILTDWAALAAPKPLVVLFDEVDVLQDQSLISFLRQLRGGFAKRGIAQFPVSVALVGMRDLRDYLVKSKDGDSLNPGSPFNIKEDSATLSNFTALDIRALTGQHAAETGQVFEEAALDRVWDLSRGQPWLVNALCKKCVWQLKPKLEPVTLRDIETAREMLIQERAVHLDSLTERLKDRRAKRIVQLMLTGDSDPTALEGDDFRFTLDMGLVTVEEGTPGIANPIYREIIARVLSEPYQLSIPAPEFRWKKTDGSLDTDALLKEFQKLWRRHADLWEVKADCTEAFPHLLLMAFLQRVLNGGGRLEREYAAGRGRMDLALEYCGKWSIVEIKLVHPGDGRETTVEEGLAQVDRYRDRIDTHASTYLIVFDRTAEGRSKAWDARLAWDVRDTPGGPVTVVGA